MRVWWGADGQTHAGAFDVTYLSCLPGMVVMAAGDEAELVHMVRTAVAYDEGPMAFRYPRGEGVGVDMPERGEALTIGKGRILRGRRQGGSPLLSGSSAGGDEGGGCAGGARLSGDGGGRAFAKPLDTEMVERLVREHEVVITVEEASIGGFAAQVLEHLAKNDLIKDGLKIRPMHLPDRFQDQASPYDMYEDAELNAKHIVQTAFSRSSLTKPPPKWRGLRSPRRHERLIPNRPSPRAAIDPLVAQVRLPFRSFRQFVLVRNKSALGETTRSHVRDLCFLPRGRRYCR